LHRARIPINATIYYDLTTGTLGAIYGVSGVSPVPVLPDSIWQIPLALVYLTSGQTTVVATNISDVRSWLPGSQLKKNLGTISVSPTINCNGAASVNIQATISASLNITLTNLRQGVPVQIWIASSGSFGVTLTATTPGGVSYTVTAVASSGAAVVWSSSALGLLVSTQLVAISLGGNGSSLTFLH
jgi:hypothetical protein